MKKKAFLTTLLAGLLALSFSAPMLAGCGNKEENGGQSNETGDNDQNNNDNGENNSGSNENNENNENDNAETPAEDTSTPFTGKIYLVGDSTVCAFSDAYYIPRYGYGTQLYNYINIDSNNIVNYAWSGRSSYSLMTDANSKPNYDKLVTDIAAGDYLFIGFGHNDEKFEVARYADPTLASDDGSTMIGTYNAGRPVSFKYILKHYYIDVALEAGATPVLCTPISRLYTDDKKASYDTDHVTTSKTGHTDTSSGVTTNWNGGDYAQAIRELGEELNLTVIDLTATTRADYKEKGYDEASKYHAATGAKWTDDTKTEKQATGIDATHTNLYGAKMNAYYIAQAVKSSDLSLKNNIITNVAKPTYEENVEACINAAYTVPETDPFNPATDASTRWNVTESVTDSTTGDSYKWYGTAFGNSVPLSSFSITQGSDDSGTTFKITAASGKGKIESGGDILAAVFIQLPLKTAFTMTATATVESYGGNQAGFGIMLRDDIYIDYDQTVNSNYVTAGCYGTSAGAVMGFVRNGGTLAGGSKNSSMGAGTYELSLARTSQSVTAKIGTYTYNAESDFDFAVSDGEYVYLCLWVTRGTTVTFSNIKFATSEWQQA